TTLFLSPGVATSTLNRPDRLNALTFDVYRELRDAFRTLDDEPGVRAVIITGAGRAFCSGGDVEDIIGALFARDDAGLLEFTRLTCDLILAMRHCRRPIVCALNGTVAGAGAVIATACDLRIGAETAKIAFRSTKVRLPGAALGAGGGGPRVRRAAGPRTVVRDRDHEGRAQSRGAHGSRHRARGGSAGAGRVHAEPQLPRSLRRLQGEARAQIRVTVPDPMAVCAFLTESHVALAGRVTEYVPRELAPLPEPADDAGARPPARDLVLRLGRAGWFAPIGDLDLRAACLVREALAGASPLAD